MARRKRNYKNNELVTTFVNNRMVDASKARKEREREAARAERKQQREGAARVREERSLRKKREAEAEKKRKSDQRVEEKIGKIAVRLTHEFEKNNLYNSEAFVRGIAGKCYELSFTPAASFKEYVLPFIEKYRLQSVEAYFLEEYGDDITSFHGAEGIFKALAVEFSSAKMGTSLMRLVEDSANASEFVKMIDDFRGRSRERKEYIESISRDFFTEDLQGVLDSLDDEDLTVGQLKHSPRIQGLRKTKLDYICDIEQRLACFSKSEGLPKSDVDETRPILKDSHKKRLVTILCFILYPFGLPRFYLGRLGTPLAQLLLLFGPIASYGSENFDSPELCSLAIIVWMLWGMIDFILVLCGRMKDGDGNTVKRWI